MTGQSTRSHTHHQEAAAATALRRIQLFYWAAVVVIVALFAAVLSWLSFQQFSQFTSRALSYERQTTCQLVRFQIENYLRHGGYTLLLPGKDDAGLNQQLVQLVEDIPSIRNIRVLDEERYPVATAGEGLAGCLGPDLRDRCCTIFDTTSTPTLVDAGPGDSLELPGRFHDPYRMDLSCVEAPLRLGEVLLGRVAVHEDVPLARHAYTETLHTIRILIYVASALLLLAVILTVGASSREISRLEERIARADRNAALGSLAAGVAHEIRNPLNTIALSCQFLSRKLQDQGETRETLNRISSEVQRLKRTIDTFVQFSRLPRLVVVPLDLDEIIDSALELLDPEIAGAGVQVIRRRAQAATLHGDRQRLREVFVNLIRNGVQALSRCQDPRLEISTRQARRSLLVELRDNGEGMSPEARKRAFEPYFSTKAEGMGLGLMQVQRDVRAHGGSIEVESEPEGGTRFLIRLPLAAPEAPE